MPEPLRRAVHQFVTEATLNLQEVLRYTEPDQAHDWKRMTLYRATNAADTMNTVAMLLAAYCQKTHMDRETLTSYLQTRDDRSRAAGPQDADRARLARILDDAPDVQLPEDVGEISETLFAEAVLHGLRAKVCNDVDSLDSFLPPPRAALARQVADVFEGMQPATA